MSEARSFQGVEFRSHGHEKRGDVATRGWLATDPDVVRVQAERDKFRVGFEFDSIVVAADSAGTAAAWGVEVVADDEDLRSKVGRFVAVYPEGRT